MIPIAGLQSFTTIDYPGHLSCVVFAQGCPWRCRYCQNAGLWSFDTGDRENIAAGWEAFIKFLKTRQTLLDAVVFSGGEVTAHGGLLDAMHTVKDLGFKVGLHTAGMYPKNLKKVIEIVDWIGFDLKAPLDHRYDKITMIGNSSLKVSESLDIVIAAAKNVQYRCTWHPLLLSEGDLGELRAQLVMRDPGAELVIQKFRTQGCQDRELLQA